MKKLQRLLIALMALICCVMIPAGVQAAASGKPVISNTQKTITLYSGDTLKVKVNASGGNLKYKWTYSKNGGKTWLNVSASQRTLSTYTEAGGCGHFLGLLKQQFQDYVCTPKDSCYQVIF